MVLLGRNGLRPANPRPFAPCSRSPVVTRNTTAQPTAESNCGALSARFGAGTSNGTQPPEPPRVAKETQGQEASNPPCSGRFGAKRRICRAKKTKCVPRCAGMAGGKKTRGEKRRVGLVGVRGEGCERRPYLAGEEVLGLEASERGHIGPT